MKTLDDQIHLKNMLSCIDDIENYCPDLTPDELEEDDVKIPVYRSLTMIGIEASQLFGKYPVLNVLQSFKKADFIDGIGQDVYAMYNFIVNDLGSLKQAIIDLSKKRKTRKTRSTLMSA